MEEKVNVYALPDCTPKSQIKLPLIFSTPIRPDLIHKAYINLQSHSFQPKGTHPTAGMDVVARSNDPPTGQGSSRIAKMRGGGGGRQGQAGGVASVRGGRQAHPPNVAKVIYKKLNKKENKLALCSAIAATASKALVQSRGHDITHYIESYTNSDTAEDTISQPTLPIVLSNDIESINKTRDLLQIIKALHLTSDITRLQNRKSRTGKSALRGRTKKVGKSILFVVKSSEHLSKAAGSIPGVDVQSVNNLSVLDLAPGSSLIRLVIYSENAIQQIADIQSPYLKLVVKIQ